MAWYYIEDGVQKGPFSEEEFFKLVRSGAVTSKTWVWRSGLKDWKRWEEIQDEFQTRYMPQVSGVSPWERVSVSMRYGGFWRRLVAKFLDGVILSVLQIVVAFTIGGLLPDISSWQDGLMALEVIRSMLGLFMMIGYDTLFVGMYGATPGKMALGMEVVRPDGTPVGYGKAFGRALAEIISAMIFYLGYLIAAFDSQKRTLHDRICGTRVVRKD
jgi:uncharacterized RDD family membrane protein YckC